MNISEKMHKTLYQSRKNVTPYFNQLCNNITATITQQNINSKKLEKMSKENTHIPTFYEYNLLLKYNYSLQQLKEFKKSYKLKITGNKDELCYSLFSFLYLSTFAIKIQKIIRGFLSKKYIKLHGPALKNRSLCNNTFDFLSMDELTTISNIQFFSFCDEDGFIYGFDILTLYNLIQKSIGIPKNPFNNIPIHFNIIEDFKAILRLSKILKIKIVTKIIKDDVSQQKKPVDTRTTTLFQNIDMLGHYTNPQWFLELDKMTLIKFISEVQKIWHFRANLSMHTKRAICPPDGAPFITLPPFDTLNGMEINDLQSAILDCIEKMVNNGINTDNKCLGAYYILGSLTLVNENVANAIPWLYQAVCYNM
jgi:hypothetical protein